MWPHFFFFLYFCCDAQKGFCIHPSICPLPIHPKDNSNTNNSSPKISCHSLMFAHLDTLKCFIPPFASLFLHLFYAFLSTMPACLSLSFPCAPSLSLSRVFRWFPLRKFSFRLTFVSGSSPAVLTLLLRLCCCHHKPPQLSSEQLLCSGAQCIFKQSIKF